MIDNSTELINVISALKGKKDWVDYLSALLVPTIAAFGILIAFFQWWTNKKRLRHELFDRRYRIFEEVRDFIGKITSYERIFEEDRLHFYRATRGSRFIFDDEIAKYIDEINKGAVSIIMLHSDIRRMEEERGIDQEEEKDKKVQQLHDSIKLFPDKLEEIEAKFSKFLQLKH